MRRDDDGAITKNTKNKISAITNSNKEEQSSKTNTSDFGILQNKKQNPLERK